MDKKTNILITFIIILLITTIALWRQNYVLKKTAENEKSNSFVESLESLKSLTSTPSKTKELEVLQEQLKNLLELQKSFGQ